MLQCFIFIFIVRNVLFIYLFCKVSNFIIAVITKLLFIYLCFTEIVKINEKKTMTFLCGNNDYLQRFKKIYFLKWQRI